MDPGIAWGFPVAHLGIARGFPGGCPAVARRFPGAFPGWCQGYKGVTYTARDMVSWTIYKFVQRFLCTQVQAAKERAYHAKALQR